MATPAEDAVSGNSREARLMGRKTALLDLDGTLVDTNYHHAIAWYRAFRDNGIVVPVWHVHRAIGMGGDKLVEAVAGPSVEAQRGDAVREGHATHYRELIQETSVFDGATTFLARLRDAGWKTMLASSAVDAEIQHYLDLLDARDLVDGWTGAADVDSSKPSPDIVQVALDKVGARAAEAVMIGDSVWDVEAAKRLEVPTLCLLSGGFPADALLGAGALAVFDSLADLQTRLLGA